MQHILMHIENDNFSARCFWEKSGVCFITSICHYD